MRCYVPIILTVFALLGLGADKVLFHTPPDDAAVYHKRVRAVAGEIPLRVDSWFGLDTAVPDAAIDILHPNVVVSRSYRDIHSGDVVKYLLAQVSDVRDILGHYPPYCYPARGWLELARDHKEWVVDGWRYHGTRYRFGSNRIDGQSELTVDNLILLPNGNTYPDMDVASSAARDHRRKFFGAAQVQLVFDSTVSPARLEEITCQFLAANRPVIEAICFGANDDAKVDDSAH